MRVSILAKIESEVLELFTDFVCAKHNEVQMIPRKTMIVLFIIVKFNFHKYSTFLKTNIPYSLFYF